VITAAFLACAAWLFFGQAATDRVIAWLATKPFAGVDPKHVAAAGLLLAAVVSYAGRSDSPAPSPAPVPPDDFSLRGKFVGPSAATDAAMFGALLGELADCLEQDGQRKDGPRLKTGVAFDDLRIAAREARMRGESLGARQPAVRDAVHGFLDQAVGTSGGPVTPESRRAWVQAYRDLSKACEEAIQ